MFFEHIENKNSKSLFLKLFSLLAISKDSKVKEEQNEIELGVYSNYFSASDLIYMKNIILEDNFLSDEDFIKGFVGVGISAFSGVSSLSAVSPLAAVFNAFNKKKTVDNETTAIDIEASVNDYVKRALKVLNTEIKLVCDNAIFVYKQDPTYKGKMINQLVDKGVDRLSITPELVDNEVITILDMNDVKKSIIEKITKEQELFRIKISSYDKKIILFNLFKYVFDQVSYSEAQLELIKVICEKLGLDSEYFDEFYEATMKYVSSYREVSELINE